MFGHHFLRVRNLTKTEVERVFRVASRLKNLSREGLPHEVLHAKSIAMIFQKPSTRTRVSFQVAMLQLGGQALDIRESEIQIGTRESVRDIARTLSRYVDGIMIRCNLHSDLEEFAEYASVPIINGLSDRFHPCQALADLFTIQEVLGFEKFRLAYIGDGNNVCNSLIECCDILSLPIAVACPTNCSPSEKSSFLTLYENPQRAAADATAVYTDVWVSMGEEESARKKRALLRSFTVTAELMAKASPHAIFLHCLPAHRGEEVTEEVFESPQSRVFDQAENRLHIQKAILALLLSKHPNELLA